MLRRSAIVVSTLFVTSGCYVYRRPPTLPLVRTSAAIGRAAAIADLDTFLTIVREVHPDPDPRLAEVRDSVARAWPDSVPRAVVWRDLSRVLAGLRDGHTNLWLPIDETQAAMTEGQRVVPIAVVRTDAGVVIAAVVGADSARVSVGERLLRLNGSPIEQVVQRLGRAAPARLDAYRDRVVLSDFGTRLWLEGIRPPFEVTVAATAGVERTVTLEGATLLDMQRQRRTRGAPALTASRTADSVLVLDFASMGGDAAALRATLDSAFDAARLPGVRAVVLDLRRNGGGDSRQGNTLLSYVTAKPLTEGIRKEWRASTRYRRHFMRGVTPLLRWVPASWFDGSLGGFYSVPAGNFATIRFDTPTAPSANSRRLERPLCVLIGPGTFSSAMILANTIRRSGIGTLIGEPTGEPPNSPGEVLTFRLRNSGLAGSVSSARFVLDPDIAAADRGVLPHVTVRRTAADMIAGRDAAMERALRCGERQTQ
jgi:C-terminal processing protease CtpA/Prc